MIRAARQGVLPALRIDAHLDRAKTAPDCLRSHAALIIYVCRKIYNGDGL